MATPDVQPLSRRRRLLFWLVLLALPLALLVLTEIGVRLFSGDEAPVDGFLSFSDRPQFFDVVEVDGRPHYRVSHPQAYRARNTVFPVEKPPDSVRIFCLGGSASAGWPHPPSEIWTAYLEQALTRTFPDRRFEVINVGAHAYPSYRIRFIFERVLEFDPDLVVVYSGNNEFLESRTYLRGWSGLEDLEAAANRLATFRRLRSWVIRIRYPDNTLRGEEGVDVSANVWSKLAGASLRLREDPEQFARVVKHFRATIQSMADDAGDAGVPLMLATVPVNLRDWRPNVSVQPLAGEALDRWQALFDRGRGALLRGEASDAVSLLRSAAEASPGHAETHYRLAQALEAAGDRAAAIESYQRASDLDHNPFRSISEFNAILRSIAASDDDVHLADFERAFARASAPYAPGFDLFLDYVHPNRAGALLEAEVVFDALVAHRFVAPARDEPVRFRYEAQPFGDTGEPYDESADRDLQNTLFWLFGMMRQYDAMVWKAETLSAQRSQAPLIRPILRVFRDYLSVERRALLGQPVSADERERVEARVADYYRHTYKFEP